MAQTMKRPAVQPLRERKKQLPWPLNIYQTAVGKKWVMAITGVMLLGFVISHMVGNLHLYEGPVATYEYAEVLREIGSPVIPHTWFLWLLRVGLLGAFVLHIHSAYTLSMMSSASNPRSSADRNKSYVGGQDYIAVNFASRTMRWTGPIIGVYVVFHLLDLTWGTAGFAGDGFVKGDPYNNVVESFARWWALIIYIVANLALVIHIFHGTFSLFQSLGINSPKINKARRGIAAGVAGLILIGNLSFPILTAAGLVDQDNCEAPCGITGAEHHNEEAAG